MKLKRKEFHGQKDRQHYWKFRSCGQVFTLKIFWIFLEKSNYGFKNLKAFSLTIVQYVDNIRTEDDELY